MREKTPDSASGTTSSGAVRPVERQVDTHTPGEEWRVTQIAPSPGEKVKRGGVGGRWGGQ